VATSEARHIQIRDLQRLVSNSEAWHPHALARADADVDSTGIVQPFGRYPCRLRHSITEREHVLATKKSAATPQSQTTDYQHAQQATQRPDVGVQDQFNTRKPPKTYRYDSSLDPALSWDENRDRDLAEWLLS
jgi:hypothetical protein